jgi:hypothetical protein
VVSSRLALLVLATLASAQARAQAEVSDRGGPKSSPGTLEMSPACRKAIAVCDQESAQRLEDEKKKREAAEKRALEAEAKLRAAEDAARKPKVEPDARKKAEDDKRRAAEAAQREALLARKRAEAQAREERVPPDGGPLPPYDVRREEK